jgi:hypothetical protein
MGATVRAVPRRESELSPRDERELDRWSARLERAELERAELRRSFAAWVRRVGPAAVARRLGISRGAMDQRLRALEGKRAKASIPDQPKASKEA